MSAVACATRHGARIASGGGKGSIRFHPCGKCREGAAVLERLVAEGWTPPPDTLPAELPDRPQQLARMRWAKSFPGFIPDVERDDPLSTAARMTPDDGGVEADLAGLG